MKLRGNCGCDEKVKEFESERELKEILLAGFYTWNKATEADYEYQLSKEGFSEHCEANGYEFTENGELI